MSRRGAWRASIIAVAMAAGCAKEDASMNASSDAAASFAAEAVLKANAMPPLPQPQSPKIESSDGIHTDTGTAVLRFVRSAAGSYFYAASEEDRVRILASNPDLRFEKAVFQAAPAGSEAVPVYRFYRTDGGGHFLTASDSERDAIRASRAHAHFQFDGVAFLAAPQTASGAAAVHRLLNPANGAYLYTSDRAERSAATRSGEWTDEGIAFHALAAGRRVLSGGESAERQRLEQLEARLAQGLEERGGVQ